MKLKDILTPSFRAIGRELGYEVEFFEGRLVITEPMWHQALSTESQFCKAVVAAGYLSERQMQKVALRYRLGATTRGGVIFWQVDQDDRIHDGKVMYYRADCHRDKQRLPTWVSAMLRRRYQWPDHPKASHCLFGLHLIGRNSDLSNTDVPIAVVEAEKTAVILSAHYPQYIWLATGGLGEVQAEKFRPLRGRDVVLFPDTDPKGVAFRRWKEAALEVQRQQWWELSPPIVVSDFLERNASREQKVAKIDLVDYLFPKKNV